MNATTAEKIALVTGAGKGMGRAIALRLADQVSGVAVHYLQSKSEAEEVAEAISQRGRKGAAFKADLTDEAQAADLIKRVGKEFGRIDTLINTVGPLAAKPWTELTGSDWDVMFRTVLKSAFYCLKSVLPGMRERKWGRIINIGFSRAERLGSFPTILPYAIAKTGLLTLTRTAAVSEAAYGITVNMVSPGLIEGGLMPSSRAIPPSAIGKVTDVAGAVAFLASAEASAITGANLIVAGTWKM